MPAPASPDTSVRDGRPHASYGAVPAIHADDVHRAASDFVLAAWQPTALRALLLHLAHHDSSASHDASEPHVQAPVEPIAATSEDVELQVGLAAGLAASVGLLVWAGRGTALITSLLVSTPAWRGYDLLPVLRERDENRDWDPQVRRRRSGRPDDDVRDDDATPPGAESPDEALREERR